MIYTTINVTLGARNIIVLPDYIGATLRGGFGQALRKLACITTKPTCEKCPFIQECPYPFIFERRLLQTDSDVAPYLFEQESNASNTLLPGDFLSFTMLLFGEKILDYLSLIINAIENMAMQGLGKSKGSLEVDQLFIDGRDRMAEGNGREQRKNLANIPAERANRLLIRFATTTALKRNGQVAKNIDLPLLLHSIKRRYANLTTAFQPVEKDMPYFPEILPEAKVIVDNLRPSHWQRYSQRQKRMIPVNGVIGELLLAGKIDAVMPLLRLGEVIHVGRGTVYGLGKYVLRTN